MNREPRNDHPTVVEKVKQERTIICEWDTPKDLDLAPFFAGAEQLRQAGVDAITMADNSLATARVSNVAAGTLLQSRYGIEPLIHITCRDRNLLGQQSHLMGLHALGIHQVLVITGDPPRMGNLPESGLCHDTNSFELIRKIKQLNQGVTFSGAHLAQKTRFVVGAALNPNVRRLDAAIRRLEKKVEAGADFVMTQPIYDPKAIKELYEATKHIEVPIFIGIMPLTGYRNARFLHDRVPGIKISDHVLEQLETIIDPEAGKKRGVEIAKELLDVAMDHFSGIYLITPFTFWEMTAELTRYIREKDALEIQSNLKAANE